jgi:hypothetical protein
VEGRREAFQKGITLEKEIFFKWGVRMGAEMYPAEKLLKEIVAMKRVIRLGYVQMPIEYQWRLEALLELQKLQKV